MRRLLVAATAAVGLTPAAGRAQHHEHEHDHGGVHSHRGPGPHFIDAFYTENAYFERKLRPDYFYSTGEEGERSTARLEVEWALRPSFSVVVHAPVHHVALEGASSHTGVGDVTLGPKFAIVNDRRSFILATGADVTLPTGSAARGLDEGRWVVAPFVLAWLPFGRERRWLAQAALHADVQLERDGATRGEFGAALSWTSPLGVTPIVEWLAEVPLEGDESASWAVAPGVRWEFAAAWELGASIRVALGRPREEDLRIGVGLIRHFAVPR